MQQSRLIYNAVVRLAMLYSSQVWSTQGNKELLLNSTIVLLQRVQNQCLRRIIGVYKRTLTAALERETKTPLIALYTKLTALQHVSIVRNYSMEAKIAKTLDEVWLAARAGQGTTRRRPRTPLELL